MALPTDSELRKQIPIYSGFVCYFPDAMGAVAQLSFIANEQHSPGEKMKWAKPKSDDQQDALMRHMIDDCHPDVPNRDSDGVLHLTKEAWRGMAALQRLADSGVDIYAELRKVLHADQDRLDD